MMPIAPLMIEHRLIERMIARMATEVQAMKKSSVADCDFIQAAIDFIKTYADDVHHGKEEAILFRDLAKKPLSPEHKKILADLLKEHAMGRVNTAKLSEARQRYLDGEEAAIKDIIAQMEILASFYPKHIEKEDKHFFLPVMAYFTQAEQDAMLAESNEFDRNFINERYTKIVEKWERERNPDG